MYKRIYDDLDQYLQPRKVLILYGPRQVGKTTLIENYLKTTPYKYRFNSGEDLSVQQTLGGLSFDKIKGFAEGYELIVIDEAQVIPNIGQALKILVDQLPNIRVIVSGSSSFELGQTLGEPLTGRKKTLTLYPVSQLELSTQQNTFDLQQQYEQFLLYGQYPEILTVDNREEKISRLMELSNAYLLKDILSLERIKGADPLLKLLKLLAFQVGQLVSLSELAAQCHLDVKTVGRYIHLLEQSFVIVKLGGYSGNLRKEVASKNKYYFVDVGVRNAVISQFNDINTRNDVGALWENFVIMERIKKTTYQNFYGNRYYWRTYDQKEIDYIEEIDGQLHAYEIKSSTQAKTAKIEKTWKSHYPAASFTVIHPDNYLDFVV